ncbi:HNH endonuclease [Bombilactobacillus bombi]|uniref:HNH endonuclease n=1 Tax=Bombilactobacillus bombi TaxID=1303590 RepID=A0A417Z675_9LACO|nr:HNH endonuclease signature motif containing protein [Bombilactobacillus bombi]RHW46108.1 HNH endonuclease [Bombilactobacillus bombi]
MAKLLTNEQEKFLRENVRGKSNADLTKLLNKKFELSLNRQQVENWKKNHKVSSGLTGHFEKGNVPFNKGKHMPTVGRTSETQFKKGHRPSSWLPIGTTKMWSDGYMYTKISNKGSTLKRWKQTHKILWEKEYGPVPAGYRLIFLDQNREHISLDNLAIVSNSECLIANLKGLIFKNKELTRSGIRVAKLMNKTRNLERKRENETN